MLPSLAGRAMEVDAERPRRRQPLDDPDVGDRGRRRIGLAIAGGEGVAIAREQRARPARIVGLRERVAEPVGPGAHDRGDRALRARRGPGLGVAPAIAADDEVHADQRAFREERIERADAAVEDVGEIARRCARAPRCRSGRAARRRAPRRSGRSGRAAAARARAAARRAAGSPCANWKSVSSSIWNSSSRG